VIKLPKKKYTPKQDVQLGKEAASEVRKQYPMFGQNRVDPYAAVHSWEQAAQMNSALRWRSERERLD
jgi:hypothetical protein